jgi:hypothetical protein
MDRTRSTHESEENAYGILAVNPEGKRPLGVLRCRWEDNIKMDPRKMD